jgi:hypothetical protein
MCFDEAGGLCPCVVSFSHERAAEMFSPAVRDNSSFRDSITTSETLIYFDEADGSFPFVSSSSEITASAFLRADKERSSLRSPMPEPTTLFGTYIYLDEADDLFPSVSFFSLDINYRIFIFTHSYCDGADWYHLSVSSFLHDITSGDLPSLDEKKLPFQKLTPEITVLNSYYIYFDEAGGSFPSVSSFSPDNCFFPFASSL